MSDNKENKSHKKTVFVVEDDAFLVKAYQIKLEKEGAEVWVATDGKEALSFLEKEPADVVMLDLMLPHISGFDILSAIRKNERWKDVPVIILTNLGQPQDTERCKELGIGGYFVKSNTKINDIISKVKELL